MNVKESAGRFARGVLIVLLALVVAALSIMAIMRTRQPVPDAGETPGYSPRFEVVEELDEEESEQEETEEQPAPEPPSYEVVPTTRVLTAFGGGQVMRALTGPCPMAETVVQTSYDNGLNWISQDISLLIPVTSPSRLVDTRDGMAVVLGQNPVDCGQQVAGIQAFGGELWDLSDVAGIWRINVTDPTTISGPGGVVGHPGCEVVRLSANADGRVAALCEDATLKVSTDSAATWASVGDPIVGADAVEVGTDGLFVATVDQATCAGAQVTRYDASLAAVSGTCVPATGATAGATALSQASDGQLWLWAGDALLRSADQGATWE